MAIKPKIRTLTNNSVDILNAIRNNASINYKNYVPVATPDAESLRTIGAIIMDSPSLQNEFLSALYNRIGRVIVESKQYENPWAIFKKGVLEFGETIESIFVNIAKPFQYDPAVAENEIFKRQIPDVRSTFYIMNYQKFYKSTVEDRDLRMAFLSWDGITDLIAKIVESMYTGANYDEFLVMKYMLARQILDGRLFAVQVPTVSAANAKAIVTKVKQASNKLTFQSTKYNVAGVSTNTKKPNQYVIVSSEFDAVMDVEVLASAFNMSKAEFMGKRILVDGFGDIDNERLAILFDGDDTYTEITDAELEALNAIPAIIVEETYFEIYDNLNEFTEDFNGQGLYWNYWYHTWRTFGVSPFANTTMFVPDAPSVTSVTVSPSTATGVAGQNVAFEAEVVTANFAPKSVNWTVDTTSAGLGVTVNASGIVSIPSDVENATVTVTATSVYDDTKYDTATITVGTGNRGMITDNITEGDGFPMTRNVENIDTNVRTFDEPESEEETNTVGDTITFNEQE